MERESFVFYRSFFDAISCLTKEQKADCLDAIAKYALDGELIEMDGIIKALFLCMKPQIDANTRRYENGCKGGRPNKNQNETNKEPNKNQVKTKTEPNKNQNETTTEPNVNVNDNDNNITPLTPLRGEKVNPKDLVAKKGFPLLLSEQVIKWLDYKNEKRQGYKKTGLESFLTQVENKANVYGAEKVASVISASMGANYQGVVWDWLSKKGPPVRTDWANIN